VSVRSRRRGERRERRQVAHPSSVNFLKSWSRSCVTMGRIFPVEKWREWGRLAFCGKKSPRLANAARHGAPKLDFFLVFLHYRQA